MMNILLYAKNFIMCMFNVWLYSSKKYRQRKQTKAHKNIPFPMQQ